MRRAGHQVAAVLPSALNLTAQIECIKPDIFLIETDSPSRDTLENLAVMHRDMPRPVIILTTEDDTDVMQAAFKSGVSAYVVDYLDLASLYGGRVELAESPLGGLRVVLVLPAADEPAVRDRL